MQETRLSIHVDGHLDFYQGMSVPNKVTVNIHLQVLLWTQVLFLLGRVPEVELLGSAQSSYLTLKEATKLLS